MLGNARVKEEIERLNAERQQGLFFDARAVLQKYIDIAFSDIGDYVMVDRSGFTVSVKPLEEMDTSIISELSNTENGIKLKLADKMKALEFLSKYTDLLNENDRKKLQEEKLKTDIAKTKAEVERISQGTPDKVLVTIVDDIEDEDM